MQVLCANDELQKVKDLCTNQAAELVLVMRERTGGTDTLVGINISTNHIFRENDADLIALRQQFAEATAALVKRKAEEAKASASKEIDDRIEEIQRERREQQCARTRTWTTRRDNGALRRHYARALHRQTQRSLLIAITATRLTETMLTTTSSDARGLRSSGKFRFC